MTDRAPQSQRLESIARQHLFFVWRVLRRLGLTVVDADDAAQRVLITVARRLDDIEPGRERAFLSRTATYIALRAQRNQARLPEDPCATIDNHPMTAANPEELLAERRTLERLDALLNELPMELRAVFVLYEIEGMSQEEVMLALDLPKGTVASRLRRARQRLARMIVSRRVVDLVQGGAP